MKNKFHLKNLRCSLHMLFVNKWSLWTKIGLPTHMLDAWKLLILDLHGKKFEVEKRARSQIWKQKEVQKNSKSIWSNLKQFHDYVHNEHLKMVKSCLCYYFSILHFPRFYGLVALCSILKYRKIGIVGRNNKLVCFMDFFGVG